MDAVNIAFHLQMNCSNILSSDSSKGIISNQCNHNFISLTFDLEVGKPLLSLEWE